MFISEGDGEERRKQKEVMQESQLGREGEGRRVGGKDCPGGRVRNELEGGKLKARVQARESSPGKRRQTPSRHLLPPGDDEPKPFHSQKIS